MMEYVINAIVIPVVCILPSIVDKAKDMFYRFYYIIWTINCASFVSLLYCVHHWNTSE